MRMSRVQVYLPDELHARMKAAGLSPSELLQQAVREELRRRELNEATDAYLADLIAEVGEPSSADVAYAQQVVRRMQGDSDLAAG
jgi:post-segregation antitoxin (ccd killing protein)